MSTPTTTIESVLHEHRVFEPPTAAAAGFPRWHIPSLDEYRRLHRESIEKPDLFWGRAAKELHWFKPWKSVLEWKAPDAKWFAGGRTNVCYNCVDRQVDSGHGDQLALIWEGEPMQGAAGGTPEIRRLTYRDLQKQTVKLGHILRGLGVKKGDVVTIYMGMVPELAIAMLACARIGAAHSVIFGGFSAQSIADRVYDASSRVIITCDGAWRRGKVVPLKENVDSAINTLASAEGGGHKVNHVLVLRRTGNDVAWHAGRDHDMADMMSAAPEDPVSCQCESMDAEDMLFLLYTSGSTGKPKGILHTTGGYMVYTYLTAKYVFNLIPDSDGGGGQVFWCTADCGWVTGHSYIVYGILPNRVPTLMYEGAPNYPGEDRFWDIVSRHKVTQFYTAPTAIRTFMKWGPDKPARHNLRSLKVLGTVGEPINPEAWMWYHRTIGGGTDQASRCPIVDTYWQTETGGHVITPLPGATPTTPGSCTLPFFGIDAAITDAQGKEQPANHGGLLVIRKPWPGMLRGIYKDHSRYVETYWSKVVTPRGEKYYCAGDAARRDERGYFWIMGRIDDVINVSGHRLGTMEVESALVSHKAVVEAAVVGMPHEIKGTGVAAFVTLNPAYVHANTGGTGVPPVGMGVRSAAELDSIREALREHVGNQIGAIAKPDMIRFTPALPKTRSGKIMRRLLRDIAAGVEKSTQDTTTLEDFSVLAKLRETEES